MAHEQSETVQRSDGKWINVYGSGLPKAGQQLPDSGTFSTMEDAVSAAKKRSSRLLTDEEFLGTGGGTGARPSSSLATGPSPASGPSKLLTDEEFLGPAKSRMPEGLDKALSNLKAVGGEAAALSDLVLSLPGFAMGVGAQLGGTVQAFARGEPAKVAYAAGREAGHTFAAPFMNPMQKLLNMFNAGKIYEDAATTKGMEKLSTAMEDAGKWVEEATSGRVARDAVPMFIESLMVGAVGLAKGPKPGGIDPVIAKNMRQAAEKLKEKAEVELAETTVTPDQAQARAPVQQQINDLLGIRTPAERARITRQRRKDIKEAFERPAEGSDFVDIAESQFRAGERTRMSAEFGAGLEGARIGGEALELPLPKRPERIGQAEILRIMQKPGHQRTAEDLITLRQARREGGKATPEALMLLGAAGLGATAGAMLDDETLRGATLGGLAGGAAVLPFAGRGAGVASRFKQAGAVKGPGGLWHPEAVERLSEPLYAALARGREADLTAPGGDVLVSAMKEPTATWASSRIKNYLNKYAGTAKDPLKDVEIPGVRYDAATDTWPEGTVRWEEAWDRDITAYPAEAYGRRHLTRRTAPEGARPGETVFDVGGSEAEMAGAIGNYLSHVGDYLRQNVPPEKLSQYDLVRAVKETAEADKRAAKAMEKAQGESTKQFPIYKSYPDGFKWVELKLPDELTPEQAKRVKAATPRELVAIRGALEDQRPGLFNKGDPYYIATDAKGESVTNSFTQELAVGKTPQEAWLAGRLAEEGNAMGHCVGGYCPTVAAGDARIFSLRDPKGKSHVTVEVAPPDIRTMGPMEFYETAASPEFKATHPRPEAGTPSLYTADRRWSQEVMASDEFKAWRAEQPSDISQIKGKQNRAPNPEYLPYVQDFVRSGKWGEVGDLQNTGLISAETVRRYSNQHGDQAVIDLLDTKYKGERYVPKKEIEDLQTGVQANNLMRSPGRGQQGFVDQRLVMGLGALGLGGLVGSIWSDDPVRGGLLGLLATGALGLPGVRGTLKTMAAGADDALGMISTRVRNASPELHQRLITYEQRLLEKTHEQLNRLVPWMKESVNLPKDKRDALDSALFMKDKEALARINKGNPELVKGWSEVRNVLTEMGEKAHALGRFKELLEGYFPQRVKDYPGLKAQLEQPVLTRIEKVLKEAQERAFRLRKTDLTAAERDAIINRELRDYYRPQQFRPGYAKPRTIQQVTQGLRPFYHTPQESLHITVSEMVKDLELVRLFGRDIVHREQSGRTYIDFDASIGNIVGRALAEGKLKEAQFKEVESIIRARFGPGERSPSKAMQNLQNLGYAGLLADIPSAIVQLADTAIAIPAHGLRSTVVALGRKLSGKAKITAQDMSLMDHVAEDLAFGSTQTGASRFKTRMTVGAGATAGAIAGAILQDDIRGALPGAAAGAFVGYASVVGTAAALNKVLRQGVFSPIDKFGKDIQLGAAHARATKNVATASGRERFAKRYQESFGEEFPQLVDDLQRGRMTGRVRSMLFAELSRTQPISKLEAPKLLLEHPNGRIMWQLKRFMLKQADFIRREAYDEIKTGDPKKIARGLRNLTEYTTVLGLSGATTAMLQDWILGRDVHFEATDVFENALKTFGLSRFVLEKATSGGSGPIAAIGGSILPPYVIMDRIINADPKAVQYIPIVGQLYYNWELGGKERAEIAEKRRTGERLSPEARAFQRKERRENRAKRREEERKKREERR
jgi:hypothetical protein